ncbi:hypothetical protein L596_016369 [Steinernema carpocapsae]|uniref:Uncharacterized protein n=1 Tax=Steinernema carpocapsae TaxID=34508 RepID=A0A4U5NIY9_STECR|nr:hypothetical protein L596_016369 [Steinernema carpocapsae]
MMLRSAILWEQFQTQRELLQVKLANKLKREMSLLHHKGAMWWLQRRIALEVCETLWGFFRTSWVSKNGDCSFLGPFKTRTKES